MFVSSVFLQLYPEVKGYSLKEKILSKYKCQQTTWHNGQWFRDTLEKIEKQLGNGKSADPAIKEEKFVFPINHEDEIPSWAQEMTRNIKDIRLFIWSKQ